MKLSFIIRNEKKEDYRAVEEMTRKAFWNLYVPGCDEHYLAHILRTHRDFIPELDLVLEADGQIIGNVMYTKAWLTDGEGTRKEILTFGPVSIHPDYQRMGCGKKLLQFSFEKAAELGYDTIVIMGEPGNYVGLGFKSCQKYEISMDGTYPSAMMVKELIPGVLEGRKWAYEDSPVYDVSEKEAEAFDGQFEKLEKEYRPSQESFYIYSRSSMI